jgi:hypothetical protein
MCAHGTYDDPLPLTWGPGADCAWAGGVRAQVCCCELLSCQVRKCVQRHLQQCSNT